MYAMLGGITGLFSPGDLGSFVDPVGHRREVWGISDHTVYADSASQVLCTVKRPGYSRPDIRVVILISPETKSSGEAVAISFKGRKNTRFIGEPTGGYTTSNYSFQFTDECGFFLSASIEADR